MAIALKIRIRDLFPEFLANALIIFGPIQPTRAISPGPLQALPNHPDHLLILV
jgi:hypothetical protein